MHYNRSDGTLGELILYTPERIVKTGHLLVYLHGGGMVIEIHKHHFPRIMANRLGVMTASVSYRISPEFPYPIPPSDCFDAVTYLHANHQELGGFSKKYISVFGESGKFHDFPSSIY